MQSTKAEYDTPSRGMHHYYLWMKAKADAIETIDYVEVFSMIRNDWFDRWKPPEPDDNEPEDDND